MAQISQGILSQQDELEQTPLWRAFERFKSTLDVRERATFTSVTLREVLVNVKDLDRMHAASSKSRFVARRLETFFNILDRYGRALDSMAQAYPYPSALIWGMVRVILESFTLYFDKLVAMIEKLSDSFSRYQEYEVLIGSGQRFQAALAAAYYDILIFLKKAKTVFMTKGFTILCKTIWRTFEVDFRDTLEAIARHTSSLEEEISLAHRLHIRRSLEGQSEEQRRTRQSLSRIEESLHLRRKVIMEWLSPINMAEIRSRESQRRTQPCGEWLLRHEVFQAWLQFQHRAIWISGSPGSGKTVLSTCIIDTMEDRIENNPRQVLAFFFCDKSDQHDQSALTILAGIIGQVLAQLDNIPSHVYTAYNIAVRYGRSKISVSDQPTVILKDLALSLDKLYVIVDGLDELKDAPTVINTMKDLVNSSTMIQVIFLSRRIPAISSQLSAFPTIDLTSDVVSSDINNYISQELAELPTRDPGLQNQIFQRLSQNANGMFLWASLMIQTLKLATSPYEIVEVLSDLPIGLDTIYGAILNKLAKEPPRRRALAKRILLLICCSARPLHWNELESILAFEKSHADLVESKKPFKSAVLELSGSLIEYLPVNDVFRLVHLSAREFLVSSPDEHTVDEGGREFFIQEEVGHSELAEICLLYQIRYGSYDLSRTSSTAFPFLEYSTLFWCHHTCHALHDADLERKIEEFLSPRFQRQIWILRFLTWKSSTFPLQYLMKLQKLLEDWIAQGQNSSFQHVKIDWIQDIPNVLLSEGDYSFGDEDQSVHNDLSLFKKLMPPISYFGKLMVIRDLSREYTMRGALLDGERWLTDALNDQRVRHGALHISTVWLMNSLGLIYDQQQRVSLSAQTQESALAIQTSVLGPDHLETIWTVNELGRIYRHLNDFDKAESMHQRALTVLRNVLHPQDLEVAWTLNTLARTRRKQRRFDEAIALHNQALDIQRAVLGELHPHTLWATMDKAACYYEQRHLRESADLYRKALEGRETVLGLRHADTLWAVNDLGLVLAEMGQMEAARELQERALSCQTEILGYDHPHTVWTRDVLDRLNEGRSWASGINAPPSATHPS